MQYNTQRVFHLNPYPGPFLHTRGKHSQHVFCFLGGHRLHGFPSTSFGILDDVSHRSPTFLLLLNKLSEATLPHQLTLKSSCINSLQHLKIKTQKRKIKQTWGKANVGVISFTNGDSLDKEHSKRLSLVRDLSIPWIMSKLHHIFGIKQKLSIYSFYSLPLLLLFYITIPSKK